MEKGNDNKRNDFLSKLPDDILSSVISSLCIRDVAKLRTVSRRWRYICPSNSNLELDTDSVLGGKVWKLASERERRCKFVHGVGQCLKLYEGQKIDSLRILFPLGDEYANHIDRWISSAVRAGTQKLDLDFWGFGLSDNLYEFACPILSECKPFQLKHLCLNFCKLRPSPHLGSVFISLNKLDLINVSLDKTSTDTIISSGLNLEWLRLMSCSLPETLSIEGPLIRLKSLIFHSCEGVEKIDISSASLTTFEYLGYKAINLSFHEVPHLERVHMLFLRDLTKAVEYTYNRLPRDVPHLQHLSVVFLTAKLNRQCQQEVEQQDYFNHIHYQLKEVEVHGMSGTTNEIEFVIYLLKNAITLKQMTLSPHSVMYHGDGTWNKGNRYLNDKRRQHIHDSIREFIKCDMELVLL